MFYLYCLSDEAAASMVEGAAGIAGVEPRLIDCGGLAAVVSDFADERIAVTRENVLAHERVVERVLAHTTPLPFRFGTVTGRERLESYVASQMSALKGGLERVRGAVEMSVKVIWNVEEIKREALAREVEAAGGEATEGAGTKFLLEKRREIIGDERLKARAEELQKWLEDFLRDAVKESFVQVNPAEKLFLSASHLVERARLDAYRARLEEARAEHRELHFLMSGPWAPYSFSNLFS